MGFTLGLLGGGGSILAIPLLLYFVGIRDAHVVIGTSALAVAANAYINLISHWRAGHVAWKPAVAFAIPGVVGAFAGSSLGKLVPDKPLLSLFAILMIVIAILMIRPKKSKAASHPQGQQGELATAVPRYEFHWARVITGGFIVGMLSGFFGIGGGFLIVPGLVFSAGLPMIMAIGSSLFSVGTFGLTTAVSYALSGLVDWIVVLEFIGGGIIGGLIGALLAGKLSKQQRTLNYIFAIIIIVVAIYMLVINLRTLHL